MKKSSLISSTLVAGALVLGAALPASAAPAVGSAAVSVRIVSFANCTAMHKVYRGGVAKAGVKYNTVSGKKRAFTIRPTFSTALYNANRKLDRDKDGIACEA